jgi:adenylosuccinate lyase
LLEWLLRRAAPQQLEVVMNGSNGPEAAPVTIGGKQNFAAGALDSHIERLKASELRLNCVEA